MTPQDAYDGMVLTPWNDDTVTALNDYQSMGIGHPYTCPRDHIDPDTGHADHNERVLDVTEAGFVCPEQGCGYVQRWAHAWSADSTNLAMMLREREELARYAG